MAKGLFASTTPKTRSATGHQRLLFVDAARGVAMLFVLLSHFNTVYFHGLHETTLPALVARITMVASPTFMIISGSLLGFLFATRPSRVAALKARLTDRGLFLLTVGHILITVAHVIYRGSVRWVFITDAVGFSMIAGAYLIDKVTARRRLALAAVLYLASWVVLGIWNPDPLTVRFIKQALVGPHAASLYEYNFPLLPWFSLYLASTVIGERLGQLFVAGDRRGMSQLLARLSVGGIGLAIALRGFFEIGKALVGYGRLTHVAGLLVSAQQKVPPGPIYVMFYGGLGVAILAGLHALECRRAFVRGLRAASLVGQSSLFIFIAQYYVYFGLMPRLHLGVSAFWPVYFLISVAFIGLATYAYHRLDGGKFITVGYVQMRDWLNAQLVKRQLAGSHAPFL